MHAHRLHVVAIVALLGGCSLLQPTKLDHGPPPPPPPTPAEEVARLSAELWQELLRVSPTWASYLGDRSRDPELEDLSEAAVKAHLEKLKALKARAEKVDAGKLSPADRVTLDVLRTELGSRTGVEVCQGHRWEVDQLAGPQVWLAEIPQHLPIAEEKHGKDQAARFGKVKKLFEDHVANLRAGLAAGYVAPKTNVERVIRQLTEQLAVDPAQSPYVEAAKKLPESFTPEQRKAVEDALLAAAKDSVYPGLRLYKDFLEKELLPKAREDVAVVRIPGGDRCYAALVDRHTGSSLSADELHLLGLDEVKRIHEAMLAIVKKKGGKDLKSYMKRLKGQRSQYLKKPADLLAHNQQLLQRALDALPLAFNRLPSTKIEVRPIEAFREKDAPAAYYYDAPADGSRPAYYYVNTHAPETRPLFDLPALAFHEAVPGHHLQVALANENHDLPEFRRRLGQSAFVEGWALYAESVADELGLYAKPEEKLGALNFEVWRAARLVVDTGMHMKGWSRAQAIAYLKENTFLPDAEIENEVDRYVVWPAQALAYKVGQLELQKLRAEAETKLGDRFDLLQFHDRVLSEGALPLPTLRRVVESWVSETQAAPAPAAEAAPAEAAPAEAAPAK